MAERDGIVIVPETPGGAPAPPATVAELRKQLEEEWGTYIATGPIDIDGVHSFNRGDAVPKSHVERKDAPVSADQVAKVGTKAAEAIKQ